jgi:uncharacterized protein YdeI (YjbR/CyaY-like superfamily)
MPTPRELPLLHAPDAASWRRWLREHHDTQREVWLVFYKKHTGKRWLRYPEALDEALCFGWIDSIVRRLDEDRYAQKFTPRANPKRWSEVNLAHARRLVRERRMTRAGLRAIGVPLDAGAARTRREVPRPDDATESLVVEAIGRNTKASAFFAGLAPGYRRQYVRWILAAKREVTRERRLAEAIELLGRGVKALMK